MKRYFLAEKLKYHHTSMKKITVIMPVVTVLLSAWLTSMYFTVDSYNWWYTGLYPGFLGILCGMIGDKDKAKKNHTIYSLPCSMGKIWNAKVLVGVMMSGVAVICFTFLTILTGKGMEIIFHIKYVVYPSVGMQILAGIIMWLTTLWEIPFCLFLSQKMGRFLMILLHVGLYTILSVTVSLESWFTLFPGAITSRLMCPILGVLPNGLPIQTEQMAKGTGLAGMGSLPVGILASLIWFGLFLLVSRKWFERQVASE